ncbi:Alanine--tRNA ligase, partial [Dictyocoela roeselum]
MYTATKLRKTFIDYFVSKDHKVIESSSVIPTSDKSLLFVNSGMVQFKKLFTSEVSDFSGFKELRRAVSVQRCVRAGGKHNDLDDVGMDNYHHTYFEMLGNWSFGDYFKAEAVDFAYDFLVNVLKLEKTKLYVTYFRPQCSKGWHSKEYRPDKCPSTGISEDSGNGDNYKQLFDEDLETKSLWMKYFPENRILPFEKENFWEMGDTGPCGPCTEIHYDRIGNRDASSLVNKDDPDVIEIWNIVFMEYCRSEQGFTPLKKKCIDTGMGLERVLSILNGVRSNYMIESFTRIFDFLREKYNLPEYSEPENKNIEITDSRNAGAEDTDFKDTTNEDTDLKGTTNEDTDLKDTTNQDTDLKGTTNQDTDLKDINVIDKNLKNMTIRPRKDQTIIAYRIIADHCRTISVCLYDGVEFSSEGRGYVLRRITRRAIRYLHDIFNLANGELSKICNFVSQHLHLSLSERHLRMIDDEENLFLKTLEKGKIYFNKITKNGILSGYDIFILHDTYGFPVDLSIIMANENKIDVNVGDYERYKEQAKERSRKKEIDGLKVELNDLEKYAITDDKYKYMILDGEYVITDDRGKFTIFDDQHKHSFCRDQNRYEIVDDDQYRHTISGNYIRHTFPHNQNRHAIVSDKKYKHSMPEFGLTSNVLCVVAQNKVIDIDDIECINTQNGVPESKIGVICDKTCFYAEKGGQVGDQGIIYFLHTNEKGISELSGKLD